MRASLLRNLRKSDTMSFSLSRIAFVARAPIAPLRRAALTTPIRYNSSTAKQGTAEQTTGTTQVAVSQTEPGKHVNASTEEGGILAAAIISGAPSELQARTVRIYKPSKPATQSSNWPGTRWKMDWDVLTRRGNWENPLMGWTSSADHMQGTHIWFKTKEDAIYFAEKQGYEYYVQEPNVRAFRPKQYAANFTHSPGKLKIIRTK